jgi:hypothetical protein
MSLTISGIQALDPNMQARLKSIGQAVEDGYRHAFCRNDLAPCNLVSEYEIDKMMPPEIREMNKKASRRFTKKEAKALVEKAIQWRESPENVAAVAHERKLLDLIEKLLTQSDMADEEKMEELTIFGHRNQLSPEIMRASRGLLKAAIDQAKEASERKEVDFGVFTCMGCYAGGEVYLCLSRIENVAARHGLDSDGLIHKVWVHEQAHAMLTADTSREISEHLAQMITATVFKKQGRDDLLDSMEAMSEHQPAEYGMFCVNPNRGLFFNPSGPKSRKASGMSHGGATLPAPKNLGTCMGCKAIAGLHDVKIERPPMGFFFGKTESFQLCDRCTNGAVTSGISNNKMARESTDLPFMNVYVDGEKKTRS